MQRRIATAVIACLGLAGLVGASTAFAHTGGSSHPDKKFLEDFYEGHPGQHGSSAGHLPAGSNNVEVVGKIKLDQFAEDISDVSALQTSDGRWFAYVGNWGAKCETGGVHVVDFTDPAKPVRAGYLNSKGFGYVTEGVQALSISTPSFSGDVLVVSNEWCRATSNPKNMPGGFTLWDVTEPTKPTKLVQAFGDFDLHVTRANESHSAIAWDAGSRAFLAAIDNEEVDEVDLFEITNPRKPVLLAETELPGVNVNALGNLKTSHDFDVLRFPDGSWHLMVSDWDAGWVDVDVTDPANPVIVDEFDYAACDQVVQRELGTCLQPEGNAHQGEWTSDGSVFVGTDEDFDPYRVSDFQITSGPLAGVFPSVTVPGSAPITVLDDKRLNGPTAYGGYGCPDSAPVPTPESIPGYVDSLQPGEEKIVVLQRGPFGDPSAPEGACFPGQKAHQAVLAGWDAVLFVQAHVGPENPPFCGSGAFVDVVVGVCTNHEAYHKLFNTPPVTGPWTYPDGPAIGAVGEHVDVTATFDGWGYTRVLDGDLNELSQITIPATADEDFATGFGDLTVHEVEVARGDAGEGGHNVDDDALAYFSWYSGGLRVVDISDPASPQEVGMYIDPEGNNFWGVALAEDPDGERLILASDRDFGLFIFRYTGAVPGS